MTASELRRILRKHGCTEIRQRGSHLIVRCGKCQTVIPVHKGEDLRPGTLASIKRMLAPCLGEGWLEEED